MALGLAASGALVATRLPSGIYPEVEFPRIVVVARGGDAPPAITQVTLTRPLETSLATVLGVERIRSRTIRGAVELVPPVRARQRHVARAAAGGIAGGRHARRPAPRTEVVVERLTTDVVSRSSPST